MTERKWQLSKENSSWHNSTFIYWGWHRRASHSDGSYLVFTSLQCFGREFIYLNNQVPFSDEHQWEETETPQYTQMENVQPYIVTTSWTKWASFIKMSTPGCKCGCQDSDELYLICPGNQVSITSPPSPPCPLKQHIVMAAENLKIILCRALRWDNGRLHCPFSSLRLVISCDTQVPLYGNCKTAITKQ